ncbi:MAG: DNA repair protein RadC [Nitrospinota bacterium]
MRKYPRQPIKDWPENERPRERLIRYGADGLSEAQLLSIILGSGSAAHGKSALDIARNLIEIFGNLQEIESASVVELCKVDGMGKTKAAQVKAALDLGKRMVSEDYSPYGRQFSTSEDVCNYFAPFLNNKKKEIFKIILLDSQNFMMRDVTISEGSLTASIVHPREVFKPAIKESAAAIILVHNHPSGDPKPSQEDKSITNKLVTTGEVVGINVLDHVIIGKKGHFSFCDEKLL